MADQYAPFDPNGGTAPAAPTAPRRVATSGVGGAIKDAVAALSAAFAPKGITDRGKRVSQAISQGEGGLADQLTSP